MQVWLYSATADSIFILAPAFVVTLGAVIFASWFPASATASPLMWLMLVVGVDVAHVYSTLYRTYLDREESRRYHGLLFGVPIACWVGGVILYSAGSMAFWRVLAYLAVFHFVRQQYGFLRLYARRERQTVFRRRVEGAAIYLATLYPLIYWHTHARHFSWFLEGDFFHLPFPLLERAAMAAYVLALGGYAAVNIRCANWPKHLVLAGTALSWYTGIVVYDGDLIFTATNVVAHGVPYMALVWFHERKKSGRSGGFFRPGMLPSTWDFWWRSLISKWASGMFSCGGTICSSTTGWRFCRKFRNRGLLRCWFRCSPYLKQHIMCWMGLSGGFAAGDCPMGARQETSRCLPD